LVKRFWLLAALLVPGCGGSDSPDLPAGRVPLAPRIQQLDSGSAPLFVRFGDLDGDGHPEVVASDRRGNALNLLFVATDGTLSRRQSIALPHSPAESAILDVNSDGRNDIVVAYRSSNAVGVWTQDAAGAFGEQSSLSVGEAPQGVRVADFDNDGRADLAVSNVRSDSVSVLFGRANGFEPAVNFPVGTAPVQIDAAEWTGDGRADLAVSNFGSNSVSLLYASGARSFVAGPVLSVGVEPFGIESPDLNGDGLRDLVVANEGDGTLSRFLFSASGPGAGEKFPVGAKPDQIVILDVDRDGSDELLVTLEEESGVAVVRNFGGRLERAVVLPTQGGPVGIDVFARRVATANFFGAGVTLLDF
jgi:hypothetical protein